MAILNTETPEKRKVKKGGIEDRERGEQELLLLG
jgi:hypothetical protein